MFSMFFSWGCPLPTGGRNLAEAPRKRCCLPWREACAQSALKKPPPSETLSPMNQSNYLPTLTPPPPTILGSNLDFPFLSFLHNPALASTINLSTETRATLALQLPLWPTRNSLVSAPSAQNKTHVRTHATQQRDSQ